MRTRGVLAVEPRDPRRLLVPEQRRLLDTFAALIAIALERVHYVEVAQERAGADGVRAPAQLAAVGALARPAHAADRAGRAGRIAGADRAAAAGGAARRSRSAIARRGAAHERPGQQPARHGAPASGAASSSTAQWQPLEEVVGSALKARASRRSPDMRVEVDLPGDLPLCEFDAVLIERVLVQPAGERRQVHARPAAASRSPPRPQRRSRSRSASRPRPRPASRQGGGDLREVRAGPGRVGHTGRRPGAGDLPRHRRGASGHASRAENRPAGRRPLRLHAAARRPPPAGRRQPQVLMTNRVHVHVVVVIEDEPQIRRFVRTALEAGRLCGRRGRHGANAG